MNDITYNIQRREKRDTELADAWLRGIGVDVGSFGTTKPNLLKAQQTANKLLTEHIGVLDKPTKRFIEYFQSRYSCVKKRKHITDGDCFRILNLHSRILRGEYRSNRHKRRTTQARSQN